MAADLSHEPRGSAQATASATATMRFLSTLMQAALTTEWKSASDYFDHFGTRTLIERMESDPDLRARILVQSTGVDHRLGLRKSAESATEDLDLALEEGLTDASKLLALLPQDDRVRHLSPRAVWEFLTQDEFWKRDIDSPNKRAIAVGRLTQLLRAALESGVLSLRDIAYGIGLKRISTCLPPAELQRVVENALSRTQAGNRLSEDELLATLPLESLVEYVPLAHTWREVVEARLVRATGLAADSQLPPRIPMSEPPHSEGALARSLGVLQSGLVQESPAIAADDPGAPSELRRVLESLRSVGRLPAEGAELGLSVLLSIESLYAELQEAQDERQRQLAVREAFPNEAHLRLGLAALLNMLNPELDPGAIEHATNEALVDALLFEEERINEEHALASDAS